MFLLLIYILFSILISRSILQANIFNIASLALISYWITYPLDSINFVLNNQENLPLIIICGNSSKMITLVTEALTEINVNFEETRYGRIRVNSLDA